MARELRRHDMVGSMGRVGAAGDNAAMESFWSLLQTNVLNQQRWTTRQELRLAIVVWIERKYHRQRAQDTLGGLTRSSSKRSWPSRSHSRPKPNLSPVRSSRPDHPKTDRSVRRVALPSFALQAIRSRLLRSGDTEPDALLFSTRVGTPHTTNNIRRSCAT